MRDAQQHQGRSLRRLALVSVVVIVFAISTTPDRAGAYLQDRIEFASASDPVPAPLASIPPEHEIVFVFNNQIWTMPWDGDPKFGDPTATPSDIKSTQITFGTPRNYNHVSVSHNRRYIAVTEVFGITQPPCIWLFDLQNKTETKLTSSFVSAGEGGNDWDSSGRIYFAGLRRSTSTNLLDLYRMGPDGSDIRKLSNTNSANEFDVSVSDDSSLVTNVRHFLAGDPNHYTEIWMSTTSGSNAKRIYKAGIVGQASAHDPEFSPDNKKVVMSIVNGSVAPNWPSNPDANTAHDLWVINVDGTGLTRITQPGPISIIPDWRKRTNGEWIVYTELCECPAETSTRPEYVGAALIKYDLSLGEQTPTRIRLGASAVKWMP